MKRWLWFFVAILISTGVYFTIRYGLRPKPIPVLNATAFENREQIGAVIYKRLRQEIRGERVLLLGTPTDAAADADVWEGLIKNALADGLTLDAFYYAEGLPPPAGGVPNAQPFTASEVSSGAFTEVVAKHLSAGHLVVVHAPSSLVSHLANVSLSRQLETMAQHPLLALSVIEATPAAPCTLTPAPGDESQRIGCAAARVGKALAKKKRVPGTTWSIIERHGLKEYLVFIYRD